MRYASARDAVIGQTRVVDDQQHGLQQQQQQQQWRRLGDRTATTGSQIECPGLVTRLICMTAKRDFGADDGGATPMRTLGPPRMRMLRAPPPALVLWLLTPPLPVEPRSWPGIGARRAGPSPETTGASVVVDLGSQRGVTPHPLTPFCASCSPDGGSERPSAPISTNLSHRNVSQLDRINAPCRWRPRFDAQSVRQ